MVLYSDMVMGSGTVHQNLQLQFSFVLCSQPEKRLSIMTVLQRYAGQDLGLHRHSGPGSCKLGNFVVSTPVLSGLRRHFLVLVLALLGVL